MLDKIKQLRQMKEQMDAAKERLNNISVKGVSQGVTVVCNGNRRIIEVMIPEEVHAAGASETAKLVVAATNQALDNAEQVFESEMRGMAGGLMGGLGL